MCLFLKVPRVRVKLCRLTHAQTVVTCIATLKKSHAEDSAVSCLVLGTEASTIYILDPEAFTIMDSMGLPSQPAHISVTGLYDVDFR